MQLPAVQSMQLSAAAALVLATSTAHIYEDMSLEAPFRDTETCSVRFRVDMHHSEMYYKETCSNNRSLPCTTIVCAVVYSVYSVLLSSHHHHLHPQVPHQAQCSPLLVPTQSAYVSTCSSELATQPPAAADAVHLLALLLLLRLQVLQ
jgi:hypothetical protein